MKKKWKKYVGIGIAVILLGIVFSNVATSLVAQNRLYDEVEEIPHNKVGLLLGTSKYLAGSQINAFYAYRIEAAVALFEAGKVDFILASGDNGEKHYNEPAQMQEDLIKKGVPASKIYLDYAGFRTLDSVVRSKAIFGQKEITIISQPFHNERAILIAAFKGIDAIGYNARKVEGSGGMKVQLRERLARVKMVLDLIFGKNPKFYGKKIEIE